MHLAVASVSYGHISSFSLFFYSLYYIYFSCLIDYLYATKYFDLFVFIILLSIYLLMRDFAFNQLYTLKILMLNLFFSPDRYEF